MTTMQRVNCPLMLDWCIRHGTRLLRHLQLALLSCSYFYIKSYAEGSGVIHLAAGIV